MKIEEVFEGGNVTAKCPICGKLELMYRKNGTWGDYKCIECLKKELKNG